MALKPARSMKATVATSLLKFCVLLMSLSKRGPAQRAKLGAILYNTPVAGLHPIARRLFSPGRAAVELLIATAAQAVANWTFAERTTWLPVARFRARRKPKSAFWLTRDIQLMRV